ncbi:MAG: transposase [Candidatus Magnetoovum sp. WYHC-5]|nr:transposase [Candidatus Magnetoovum sp. WYHC-5]
MKIPCAKQLAFVVCGLAFLQPALTTIQFNNLTLIATALILGSGFNLSSISHMWLAQKCVSTLSYFFNDAKITITDLQNLYAQHIITRYSVPNGYFIVDDTMEHHTRLCKYIHGVCVLYDHILKTNLKAICIVVLYYSDGVLIKFPITFKIYYKEKGARMPWQNDKNIVYKKKYDLAIEMIEWALVKGFTAGIVITDSWYGIGPFIRELKRLKVSYVLEIKSNYNVNIPFKEPKTTSKGKISKNQIEKIKLPIFFDSINDIIKCGFDKDIEKGREAKVLYHVKIATIRLNSIPGTHRVIESRDVNKKTTKYFLTDQLTWEARKIIQVYTYRWVIEEFFRNAKQLLDMEGATIRSEQGVTLALCLVSWIDFLFHIENYKHCTAGELSKEPLTIPSIVRQLQYENLNSFMDKIKNEEDFVKKWFEFEKKNTERKREKQKELREIA